MDEKYFKTIREAMVGKQLIWRGISDERVISAMKEIPRHLFIDEEYLNSAYDDHPLPIGQGQTISQPYMVARMTELLELKGTEKVLEIGTGSGYQTTILSKLSKEVYTVERIKELIESASVVFEKLNIKNVKSFFKDGTDGLDEYSPYDAIIVTAAARELPPKLPEQLAEGGRLVIPIGEKFSQILYRFTKRGGGIIGEELDGCVFVPLVGEYAL